MEEPTLLRAVHTPNLPALLRQLGVSLAVTTYQAGKLVLVRDEGDHLNTHFRGFQAPMGMALSGDRLAVGTTIQVWEFIDVPAVTAKLDPPGRHDACFLPRSSHVTGNIQIHEMAWGAGGELWVVNTRFSCLCTIDRSASFTPRWRPPFVSALEPTDRCHLNGLSMVEDRPRYVDGAGRERRAGRLAGQQGQGRHPDRPGLWRSGHPRVVDAPLSAVARRPALGLRVGRGHVRLHRPEHRSISSPSPKFLGSLAASTSRGTSPLSGCRRCARPPCSAASRSPSGWRRRTDVRRLRDRPRDRSGGWAAPFRVRRARDFRGDGAAGPAIPGPDQRREQLAGELLCGARRGAHGRTTGAQGTGHDCTQGVRTAPEGIAACNRRGVICNRALASGGAGPPSVVFVAWMRTPQARKRRNEH